MEEDRVRFLRMDWSEVADKFKARITSEGFLPIPGRMMRVRNGSNKDVQFIGLYEIAGTCVAEAKRNGAPFKDVHRTKAEIHTWLAWQDEPGKQLHQAVHHRVLDPAKPESRSFVNWFRQLFDV